MVAQLCEYFKNRMVDFKWVNCMVCESNLNKAIKKNQYIAFQPTVSEG